VNHFLFYCLREVEASIIHFSNPPTGSEPLKFASTYALRLAGSVFYLPLETKSCIVEKSTIQWCEAIFYCISCIAISLGILGYWFKKVNSRPYSIIFFCRFIWICVVVIHSVMCLSYLFYYYEYLPLPF
jgi:hypothetical protein